MRMANRKYVNLSLWLLVMCYLMFLFFPAGCKEYCLYDFCKLENKSLENGTISAGAVRVTDYNNSDLKKARRRLADDLISLRKKFAGDSNLMPQSYIATSQMDSFLIKMAAGSGDFNLPQKSSDPAAYFQKFLDTFYDIMKNNRPQLSDIDLVGLRMATMKYIESELEDINGLDSVCPIDPDYRRVVISIDLAAWVTGKAKAALVYVDLYPYMADDWCYKTANGFLGKSKDPNNCSKTILWTDNLKLLEGFSPQKLEGFEIVSDVNKFLETKTNDPNCNLNVLVTHCHNWLDDNKLLPRIVQVERISPGEYSILAQAAYSGTELQMGGGLPTGLSGAIQAMSGKRSEKMGAKVFPLNLAFVAGQRRAGWLFMPSQTGQGKMPSTERRLRMVVDIPKDMEKLGVYVHKAFLNADLHILPDSDFSRQMANLRKARWQMKVSDRWYEEGESKFYRLEKSRIRNLFYQGWAEELVVDTPVTPVRRSCVPERSDGAWKKVMNWIKERVSRGYKGSQI